MLSNNGGKDTLQIFFSGRFNDNFAVMDNAIKQAERCLIGINAGIYSKLSVTSDSSAYYAYTVDCYK
jgi:hypothetical protein